MAANSIKNLAASVHQRLLNKAKESSRPFNELLQYFAIERFIYRLSKSPHKDQFILKGALMFSAWCGPASRPTMDIDLLGKIDNRLETITDAMKDACLIDVETDGISLQRRLKRHLRKGTRLLIWTPLYLTLPPAGMGIRMFNGGVSF